MYGKKHVHQLKGEKGKITKARTDLNLRKRFGEATELPQFKSIKYTN